MDIGPVAVLILMLVGVGVLELVGIFTLPMFFEIRNFKRFAIGLLAFLCVTATAVLHFAFAMSLGLAAIFSLIVFVIGFVAVKILF